MALDAVAVVNSRSAGSRARAVMALAGTRTVLGAIVLGSFFVRAAAATAHAAPRLFPDEYIYTALARSLAASGRPLIRGDSAHFPALLEPLLAAPLWAIASTETAYHLVQVENALFMSAAAIPVFLLARTLGLGKRFGLACAAFAVAIPDLVYSGYTLADPLGYLLALTALYAAVVALQEPTGRRQLVFLALAVLATTARLQYVVLIPAFVGAVVTLERTRAVRTYRVSLSLLGGALALAAALGPSSVLGYYSAVGHLHASGGMWRWIGTDLLLLSLASGVVIVPAALVGFVRARGRRDVAFAVMSAFYALGLLVAAGLYASNGSARFQERYLFSLLPLLPLAFGLYLRHGRPDRLLILAIGALFVIVSARVPISTFSAGLGATDSPLLWAVARLEHLADVGTASVAVAAYVVLASILAVFVAFRGRAWLAFAVTIGFAVVTSYAATGFDLVDMPQAQAAYVSRVPTWVDRARLHDVALISTPLAPRGLAIEQLFWNRSVTSELLLAGGVPTDSFDAEAVHPDRTGSLRTARGPIRSAFLLEDYGVTAAFSDARLVARTSAFALYRPDGLPRLGLLEVGRFFDSWLGRAGSLTVWPTSGRMPHSVSFRLSLPADEQPVTMRFDGLTARVTPIRPVVVRLPTPASGPWTVRFSAIGGTTRGGRPVSVRSSIPRLEWGSQPRSRSLEIPLKSSAKPADS